MFLLAGYTSLTGCSLGGRSFSVVSVRTGQAVHIGHAGHREVLLGTDDGKRQFRTLYLDDAHARFIVRTIGYDGRIVNDHSLPIFAPEYVALYHVHQGYSLSPDGSGLAYLEKSSGGLRLLDTQTGGSRSLLADLTRNLAHVSALEWVSDRQLLVAVDGTSKPYAQIIVIDVHSGRVLTELRPRRLSLLAGVRTDGAYFAYQDHSWNRTGFRIYDLRKQGPVGEITPGAGRFAGFEKWANDPPSRLLYVEVGEDRLPTLKEYDVASGTSADLKSFKVVSTVIPCGQVGSRVFYMQRLRPGFDPGRLFLWDRATQTELEIRHAPISGKVSVIDRGERLLIEELH